MTGPLFGVSDNVQRSDRKIHRGMERGLGCLLDLHADLVDVISGYCEPAAVGCFSSGGPALSASVS